MTLQLVEGQDFSASYTLLQRLARGDNVEHWLALDKSSGQRVLLRIFSAPVDDQLRHATQRAVSLGQGLIHPNIARIHAMERYDGVDFLVSEYVRGAEPFVPQPAGFAAQWPVIEQLFDTLGFAHGLGINHGHIHPGNLLIDDRNVLHVTDFGLPSQLQDDARWLNWCSPQVRANQAPDRSDDIYSMGHLLYVGLTGRDWREDHGFETNSPIPEEVRHLIARMLAPSSYDRPRDLKHIRDTVKRYVMGETDLPLENLGGFSRPTAASQSAAPRIALPRESRVMSAPVAFAGFALLVVIAGVVFFLLPHESPAPSTPQATPATSSAAPKQKSRLTPLEIAKQKELQKQGNDIATQLLKLQVGLEDQGVKIWAPDKYKQELDFSARGDAAYQNDNYEKALGLYKKGVAVLQNLNAEVPAVKAKNLAAGKQALQRGDYRTAIKAYTIANAIDPDDGTIKHELNRADNLQQVLSLIKDGAFLEGEGKFDAARAKFLAAYKLDPEWPPAKQAVTRIDGKIAKRKFDDAMSVAFTALGNQQYHKARVAFRLAQKILPKSKEPADGLQQVDIAVRQQKIDALRDQADAAAKNEDWNAAIAAYKKILGLDSTLVFANDGLHRARQRLDLQKQMAHFIRHPALMQADDELSAARELLVRATEVKVQGPKLGKQMDELSQLISLARVPVPVTVKSDNETDITVYKVGHLGKLESTSLDLVPGHYTIVGQRRGYRDVQVKLTVLGGQPVKPVQVRCTQRI